MGFEIHHGVGNALWRQNCIRGGRVTKVVMGLEIHQGVRNAIWGGGVCVILY